MESLEFGGFIWILWVTLTPRNIKLNELKKKPQKLQKIISSWTSEKWQWKLAQWFRMLCKQTKWQYNIWYTLYQWVFFLFLDPPPPAPPPPETTETVTMETTTIVLADPQPQGQEEDRLPVYLGGIAAGAVLVIFILALVLCICIKQRQRQNLTDYGNFGNYCT